MSRSTDAGNADLLSRVGKEARLWALAVVCATVGALGVWLHDSITAGIGYFALTVAVFGIPLYLYERRRSSDS